MNSGRSPTRRNSSATRSIRSRRLRMPFTSSGSPTLSNSVIRGLSEPNGSWKIIWISLRSGPSSAADIGARSTIVSSRVRYSTCPSVGSIARRMQRAVVVLPQPLSPTRPSASPSCTVKLTSSTARTWPVTRRNMPLAIGKNLRSPRTSSSGAVMPVRPHRCAGSSSPRAAARTCAAPEPPSRSARAGCPRSADGTDSPAAG